MTRKVIPLLAVAALAAALLPAASATTQPTITINIRISVTDTGITFSQYRARRGWGVHFLIRNTGKKPHRIDIGGIVSPIIQPGKRSRVSASLEERGRYPFRVTLNPGPKAKGWFIVY
jgi:hypothetical protein